MTYEDFIKEPISGRIDTSFSLYYPADDVWDRCLTTEEFLDWLIDSVEKIEAAYLDNGGQRETMHLAERFEQESLLNKLSDIDRAVDSPLYHYFIEKHAKLSRDAFKAELAKIFSRQDEMLFITNGSNISASLVDYATVPHYRKNTYFDIVYVFTGQAKYYFEENTLTLTSGDLLIVPPEILHGERAIGANSKVLSCAIRSSAFFRLFLSNFSDNAFLQSFFVRILSGEEAIKYMYFPTAGTGAPADSFLDHRFFDLYSEQFSTEPYHSKMTDALMNMILVYLLRHFENRLILPDDAAFSWKPEYSAIYAYIADHYLTVTLEELASRFHYSKRQLIRIIRECTGNSFHELILAMKMQQAKSLLQETSLSVEEISLRCGYESFSSFSRVFSKFYGTTPSGMRARKQ